MTKEQLRSTTYHIQKKDDIRLTGKFPAQQAKTFNHIMGRRYKGKPVSTIWIREKMKDICDSDKPNGYNPEKDKFGHTWVTKFMKRKKLSVRRSTNKKTKSIWERLHKIHNFHHYCVYELADDPISDMEESEGDSNESDMILDSDAGDSSSDSESNEDS